MLQAPMVNVPIDIVGLKVEYIGRVFDFQRFDTPSNRTTT